MSRHRTPSTTWAVVALALIVGAGAGVLFWAAVSVLYALGHPWIALAVLAAGTTLSLAALLHVVVNGWRP